MSQEPSEGLDGSGMASPSVAPSSSTVGSSAAVGGMLRVDAIAGVVDPNMDTKLAVVAPSRGWVISKSSTNCVDDCPSSLVGSGRLGLVGLLLVRGLGAGTGRSWSKPVGEQKPLAIGKVRSNVGIVMLHRIGATQPAHRLQICMTSGLRRRSHLHHVVGGLNEAGHASLNNGTKCSGNDTSSS